MWCWCIFYNNDCGGNYKVINGIKDCSNCLYPHKKENYDNIIKRITKEVNKQRKGD